MMTSTKAWLLLPAMLVGGATVAPAEDEVESPRPILFVSDRGGRQIFSMDRDGKKNDNPLPLLDRIEALNRFRRVKIHTFGYDPISFVDGEPYPDLLRANKFLEKLALRTGGTFTLLKVTDEKPPKDFR